MAIVFEVNDKAYNKWLKTNSSGFVITMHRNQNPSYMVLHRATCRLISTYNEMAQPGCFTERIYVKVCASSIIDAKVWVSAHGRADGSFSKICSKCKPFNGFSGDGFVAYDSLLQDQVKSSRKLTKFQREKRLNEAQKKPDVMQTTCVVFKRNPDVIVEILEIAKGYCQDCGNPAPFYRETDGSPYLEVHHKIPLAEGGDDTVENAIALCPNCHRKEHYGVDVPI